MSETFPTVAKTAAKIVTRRPLGLVNQMPTPSRLRSMYGIAAMKVSQIVGTTTPARPLSIWSRSSVRFRRDHGAFEGCGVQTGLARAPTWWLKAAERAE